MLKVKYLYFRNIVLLFLIGFGVVNFQDYNDSIASKSQLAKLSDHVYIFQGPTNVGIIRDGGKVLLIDCGEGSVKSALSALGISNVDEIWFTHYHRDHACGVDQFSVHHPKIKVPKKERIYFDKADSLWNAKENRWNVTKKQQNSMILTRNVSVNGTLKANSEIVLGTTKIKVIDTPGHTDGSLSFVVESGGTRFVFCGDLIYGDGLAWNLWSFQKQENEGRNWWYTGYLGAKEQVVSSLSSVKSINADKMIPTHGPIINNPNQSISCFLKRLNAAYDAHMEISSERWFFQKYKDRSYEFPVSKPEIPVPSFCKHVNTSWLLISKDSSAFVMDCYYGVVDTLKEMINAKRIRNIEALWVSHYHSDHIEGIPEFKKAFPDCPVIADSTVTQVIVNPEGWKLPALSPTACKVDRVSKNGESWKWHEFEITSYFFPGQTYYHAGLFVKGRGKRLFFSGDSYTPRGITNYCMQNKIVLGHNMGFDRCTKILEELQPDLIFCSHNDGPFFYSMNDYKNIRLGLKNQEKLIEKLIPWDNVNYSIDDCCIRSHPYEQNVKSTDVVEIELIIKNYSSIPKIAKARLVLPKELAGYDSVISWTEAKPDNWDQIKILPQQEGKIRLSFRTKRDVKPGKYIIPIDIIYGSVSLPQATEAIINI